MSEEKENESNIFLPIFITSILLILVFAAGYFIGSDDIQGSLDKTRAEIKQLNVSDSYMQGWLDALDAFEYHLHEGTNATSGVK